VVWKTAVDSLNEAHRYQSSEAAKQFVENYMKHILGIFLDQVPSKLGIMERNCVQDSFQLALVIIIKDLTDKVDPKAGECVILEALSSIFNCKRNYYKTTKANWAGDILGLPEIWNELIANFRSMQGFKVLGDYLSARLGSTEYPSFDIIHTLLHAAADSISQQTNTIDNETQRSSDDGLIWFGCSVMDYIYDCSEETLKKQSHDNLSVIINEIQRIYEQFAFTRRDVFHSFFDFSRKFALKLITSQSLPLRLYGWETVKDLVEIGLEYRPPPRAFRVSGAGNDKVNGIYVYASQSTKDGYVKTGTNLKYELRLPEMVSRADGTVKHRTLTLFRCTMRSQLKWWFLSEADDRQPGTDKDVDYYQHKSRKHEESVPPIRGWLTCKAPRSRGIDPPPNLEPIGLMTATGEEFNSLEHQLARWAVENNVVEIMLGDSVHREIVARSVSFIRFLACMCSRDDTLGEEFASDSRRNAYGLRASHLKLAWRICTNKLDADLSAEVLQMLVCILPNLPEDLAILLLNDVQHILGAYSAKNDSILVVAEFCSSLVTCNSNRERQNSQNGTPLPTFSDNVRLEVLKLFWNILNHPDASTLKCYDIIKAFLSTELRIEPLGTIERSSLLRPCKESEFLRRMKNDFDKFVEEEQKLATPSTGDRASTNASSTSAVSQPSTGDRASINASSITGVSQPSTGDRASTNASSTTAVPNPSTGDRASTNASSTTAVSKRSKREDDDVLTEISKMMQETLQASHQIKNEIIKLRWAQDVNTETNIKNSQMEERKKRIYQLEMKTIDIMIQSNLCEEMKCKATHQLDKLIEKEDEELKRDEIALQAMFQKHELMEKTPLTNNKRPRISDSAQESSMFFI
jgi:hypothetical protein